MQETAIRTRRAEELVRITTLKHLAAIGKLDAVTTWINDFLESGEKLVVFAFHQDVVHYLLAQFPGAARLHADDSVDERQSNVRRFQTDQSCRLIVCGLKVGSVGFSLTASSNVAFVELDWTPAIHAQAEDRCHRIGQGATSVNAWYLLARGTIDQEIAMLIERKRHVVEASTDGIVANSDDSTVLPELIDRLRRNHGWESEVAA